MPAESALLQIANALFRLQQLHGAEKRSQRSLQHIESALHALGLRLHNPLGEAYDETRTDCEASIAGEGVRYAAPPAAHMRLRINAPLARGCAPARHRRVSLREPDRTDPQPLEGHIIEVNP